MSDLQSNDTSIRDFNENISSDSINPTGESEQSVADDAAQPELLQNCYDNQNKLRDDIASNQNKILDDIASKKAELDRELAACADEKTLSAFIVKAHEAVVQSSVTGLLSAIAAGEAANKLKVKLEHGEWSDQLSTICSECGCGMSTMGKYMLLAQIPDAQDYAHLGISQTYQLCLIRNFVCRSAKIEINLAEVLSRYGKIINLKRGITIAAFKKKWAALTAHGSELAKPDSENARVAKISNEEGNAIITEGDSQANPAEEKSKEGVGGRKPQFATFKRKIEELADWLENAKDKYSKPSPEEVKRAINDLENLIESLKVVPEAAD